MTFEGGATEDETTTVVVSKTSPTHQSICVSPLLFFEMDLHKRSRRLSASNHRDWPGLPDDILLRIVDKVKVPDDYVRFGAVCRPWRSVFLEHFNTTKPSSGRPLPLLLVAAEHENAEDRQSMALYNISTGRVSSFRLPLPRGSVCRGSSFGWLLTLHTRARHDCSNQLYNPFLPRTVDLPPVDTLLTRYPERFNRPWDGYYLHKAVLSSNPSSGSHFVVMAIMSSYSGLAFCRAGDRTWTSIGDWVRGDAFYDVVFVRKTNQFCASLKSGAVVAVDCSAPKLTQIAPPIFDLHIRSYLVEDSSGDLLQVFKNFEHDHPPGTGKLTWSNGGFTNSTTTIVKFTVFKLDAGEWIKIDEIGENVMFLGYNASMLLPASDCPGCEPNCIYYTDDDDTTHHSNFSSYGPPADGVYSLKDGVARPHYSSARSGMIQPFSSASSDSVLPQAIWLQPTLRGATI